MDEAISQAQVPLRTEQDWSARLFPNNEWILLVVIAVECLLFAFTDALAARLQGVALPLVGVIPVQFILALPYALTVLLLAGFVGKAEAPRAIGVPYSKEK